MTTNPSRLDNILSRLREVKKLDINPLEGKLFMYIYETGDEDLRRLARRAFEEFLDTNALDPMAFNSALYFEKEVIGFAKQLANAGSDVVGTATYGGTESIMLAVLAARQIYRKKEGASSVPEVLVPITGHPAIRKAAWYLGLRVVDVEVDPRSKKALLDDVAEKLGPRTALVVGSAPNYPYGAIDPVKELAEIVGEKNIPLHVDACVGGFILPFLEELGERIEPYDFRVEGVTTLSMDTHKYGYAPKGSSILLFKNGEVKEATIFVDLSWPGYPLINTTVLSSRSIAPLAAAWATIRYLGRKGYLELARRVLEARNTILEGLARLGFKPLAPIESPILSLALDNEDELLKFYAAMKLKGWAIGLQPRVKGIAPYNIHLTIMPIHSRIASKFLEDAEKALEEPLPRELEEAYRVLREDPMKAASLVGKTKLDSIIIAKLLEQFPRELAEEMAKKLAVEVFRS